MVVDRLALVLGETPAQMPRKSGKKQPTADTMAGLTNHTWSFGELFEALLILATHG